MRPANCHPERAHVARGLCRACYGARYRALAPDVQRASELRYRKANRARRVAQQLAYVSAKKLP
jgi:hypothetical protein